MNSEKLCNMIDISCVRQIHTEREIVKLCDIALKYNMAAVFVLPSLLPRVVEMLDGQTIVKPASVISFPAGMDTTDEKVRQAGLLMENGCKEFDMVMNLYSLRNGRHIDAMREISAVKKAVGNYELKVIIEASVLTEEEIKNACSIVMQGGADYVKTGTGWAGPTTSEMVRMIRDYTEGNIKIKAAGGIKSLSQIEEMYELGCRRFGLGISTWEQIYN